MPPTADSHPNLPPNLPPNRASNCARNRAPAKPSAHLVDADPSSALNELSRVDALLATLERQVDHADQSSRRTHAEQASRLAELGSLAAMFAHEVNNIMTQVGGRAQLALRAADLNDSSVRAHELAAAGSKQIARLAEFFMEVGVHADPPTCLIPEPAHHAPISIRSAHEQALSYLPASAAGRYRFQLTFDPPPTNQLGSHPANPVRSAQDDVMVACPFFEQVLLNCYRNAAQAMNRRPCSTPITDPDQHHTITIRVTPCSAQPSGLPARDSQANCSTWNNCTDFPSTASNCSTWNNLDSSVTKNTLWGPASPSGPMEADSEISPETDPDSQAGHGMVRIDILDRGVGMDDRQMDRVLRPSNVDEAHDSALDSAQGMLFGDQTEALSDPEALSGPVEAGHGIGLQVCRRIIDRAHGHFELRSTPGVGTKVSVWLPTGVKAKQRQRA